MSRSCIFAVLAVLVAVPIISLGLVKLTDARYISISHDNEEYDWITTDSPYHNPERTTVEDSAYHDTLEDAKEDIRSDTDDTTLQDTPSSESNESIPKKYILSRDAEEMTMKEDRPSSESDETVTEDAIPSSDTDVTTTEDRPTYRSDWVAVADRLFKNSETAKLNEVTIRPSLSDLYAERTDSSDRCTDSKCFLGADDNLNLDNGEVPSLSELSVPEKNEDSKTSPSSSSEEALYQGGGNLVEVEDPALDWTILVYDGHGATWEEAGNKCRRQGAWLASPVNQKAVRNMKDAINKYLYISLDVPVFTGIRSTNFNFKNEEFLLYRENARSDDLNADSEEHAECLTMTGRGVMDYAPCSTVLPYMCFKKKHLQPTRPPCTNDSEYEYDASTGSCYKFHRVAAAWEDASQRCNSEGAHLAVINSRTEADALVSIMADNPVQTLEGTKESRFVTIGFKAVGDHDTWRTVFGTSLEEEGYASWDDGEPNNDYNEYCGAVYRNGFLNDVPCSYQYAFICEKNDNRTITTSEEIESSETDEYDSYGK